MSPATVRLVPSYRKCKRSSADFFAKLETSPTYLMEVQKTCRAGEGDDVVKDFLDADLEVKSKVSL